MLKPKEELFARKYAEHGIVGKAWIEAGYSPNGASVGGHRALKRAKIAERVKELVAAKGLSSEAIRAKVEQELARIAFADIRNLTTVDPDTGLPRIDFRNATDAEWAALSSIATKSRKVYNGKGEHVATEDTAKFTKLDKLRGLELLGRQHGMFVEKHEVEVVDVAARILQARQARQAKLTDETEEGE